MLVSLFFVLGWGIICLRMKFLVTGRHRRGIRSVYTIYGVCHLRWFLTELVFFFPSLVLVFGGKFVVTLYLVVRQLLTSKFWSHQIELWTWISGEINVLLWLKELSMVIIGSVFPFSFGFEFLWDLLCFVAWF